MPPSATHRSWGQQQNGPAAPPPQLLDPQVPSPPPPQLLDPLDAFASLCTAAGVVPKPRGQEIREEGDRPAEKPHVLIGKAGNLNNGEGPSSNLTILATRVGQDRARKGKAAFLRPGTSLPLPPPHGPLPSWTQVHTIPCANPRRKIIARSDRGFAIGVKKERKKKKDCF